MTRIVSKIDGVALDMSSLEHELISQYPGIGLLSDLLWIRWIQGQLANITYERNKFVKDASNHLELFYEYNFTLLALIYCAEGGKL